MENFKSLLSKSISIGVHKRLSENKKLAIQIATLDGYWSLFVIAFYILHSLVNGHDNLMILHGSCLLLTAFGIWLIQKRHYDIARPLIHFIGLFEIFLSADSSSINSGAEFYYFTSISIPFIIYSYEEQWKGIFLTCFASFVLVSQQILGTGLFMEQLEFSMVDRIMAILFVVSYFILILTVARWQLKKIQIEITHQNNELLHTSKMAALGEMAGGIAHEINNPLQSLSLQLAILKEKYEKKEAEEHLTHMDDIIQRIGKMVQGLKDLSRKDQDNLEVFELSFVLDSVVSISSEKISNLGIELIVKGKSDIELIGNPIQISQVILNLLNNSISAIHNLADRWIVIEVKIIREMLQICVTDSGLGIPQHLVGHIMKPFFTTKLPSKGTGLGLSISRNIIHKHGGTLSYDETYFNTRFVIELPLLVTSSRLHKELIL